MGWVCLLVLFAAGQGVGETQEMLQFEHYDINVPNFSDWAACDVNCDGYKDLVLLVQSNRSYFDESGVIKKEVISKCHVYPGTGNLSFGFPLISEFDTYSTRITQFEIHDFNADNVPDIMFGDYIYFGEGHGIYTKKMKHGLPTDRSFYFEDADNDTILDVLYLENNGDDTELWYHPGCGDGTFNEKKTFFNFNSSNNIFSPPLLQDINNDGVLDVITFHHGVTNKIIVWFGNSFDSQNELESVETEMQTHAIPDEHSPFFYFNSILFKDFDGDGNADLLLKENYLFVLLMLGDGHGSFTASWEYFYQGEAGYDCSLTVLDVNHDGRIDVFSNGCENYFHGSSGIGGTTGIGYKVSNKFFINTLEGFRVIDYPYTDLRIPMRSEIITADFDNDGIDEIIIKDSDIVTIFQAETLPVLISEHEPFPTVSLTSSPNPFNSTTTIQYRIDTAGQLRAAVYNIAGQRVKTLVDSQHAPGLYSTQWDGCDDSGSICASGLYFVRLSHQNGMAKSIKVLFMQ